MQHAGNGRSDSTQTPPSNGTAAGDGQSKTVVMGAGPGGLCAAYVLSKAGLPTTVVERAPFVGGLSRTIRQQTEFGEFKFDIGGHRWFTKNEELNELFREVIAEELLWVNRISRIYFDGKYVDYPLRVSNALKAVGPVMAAKAMADYGLNRAKAKVQPKEIVSMEDAYIDQYGPTLYQMFFQRYSEKVWGLPCDQMSGDWVSQRTKGMSLLTAVKDAVIPSKGAVVSLIDEFMYPRGGFGRLPERMTDAILAMGNTVELSSRVEKVHHRNGRVEAISVLVGGEVEETDDGRYVTRGGELQRIEGDNFISSIPLTHLARMMEPAAPPEVIAASKELQFRDIITVNLMLKKRQVTHDTWLYVHDRNILFGRFHEPKNWSPDMVPSDDYTSLVVEYFCTRGDHIWNMTEEQLVEQTVQHLINDLHFITKDEVLGGFIIRAPRAYPSYVIGYEKPLNTIKDYIAGFENLQYIGRGGSFRYNNTDHSIETGLLAAKNILGEQHDLDRVNADKEYHEIKRAPEPAVAGSRA